MSEVKSYAQETADRLRREGNFKDADVDVNDVIQIIEDDEDYIQSLKDENAILTERIKALEATTRGLAIMDYMRACRDVCNHAIGHFPLSDLVKRRERKDQVQRHHVRIL